MKKIFLGALFLAGTLSACKKDDSTPAVTPTGGNATVTATNYGFDGSNSGRFSSTAAGITQTTVAGITTFSISAIKDGGKESITIIVLKKITATGKITFGPDLANGGITIMKDYTKPGDLTQSYSTDNNGTSMKGGGEINITSINGNEVEGTFYAVAHNNAQKEAFAEQGTFKGTIH